MPPKKKVTKVEEAPAEAKVEQVSKPAEAKEVKEVEQAPVAAEKGKKGRPAKAPAQNGDTVPNSKPAENKEEKSEPAPAVQEEKGKKGRKPGKAAAEEPVAKSEEMEEKSEPAPVEEKGRKGRKPAAKSASEESVAKTEEKKEEKVEKVEAPPAEEKGKKGRKPAKPVAEKEEPPAKVSKPVEEEDKIEPAPVEEKGRKGRKPGKATGAAGDPKAEEKKEAAPAPVEEKAKKGRKPGKAAAEAEPVSRQEEQMEVELEEKPKKGKTPAKNAPEGEPAAKKSKADKEEEKSKLRKEASLTKGMDFTHTCKTKDGREPNWKIASWNVNGLRAWMDKGGLSYLQDEKPDILCIQETKCALADIPKDAKVDGYYSYWSSAEKAGYAGTCIYSKTEPVKVTYGLGIDKHDEEGRTITAEYDKFYLVNTYVPNSGRGLPRLPYRSKEWDLDFREYLNNLNKTKPVVMCGDLNVAHEEIDLANPKTNKKTAGFTVEERQGFTDLLGAGYIDSFRELYPDAEGAYSFWTYMGNARAKNVGWRLDYFVLSERIREDLCDSLIRKDVMGSDHCPIVLFMAFK